MCHDSRKLLKIQCANLEKQKVWGICTRVLQFTGTTRQTANGGSHWKRFTRVSLLFVYLFSRNIIWLRRNLNLLFYISREMHVKKETFNEEFTHSLLLSTFWSIQVHGKEILKEIPWNSEGSSEYMPKKHHNN